MFFAVPAEDKEFITNNNKYCSILLILCFEKKSEQQCCFLADGCSSHTTGVAMSALGGYLNFYLSEQDITKRPLV